MSQPIEIHIHLHLETSGVQAPQIASVEPLQTIRSVIESADMERIRNAEARLKELRVIELEHELFRRDVLPNPRPRTGNA